MSRPWVDNATEINRLVFVKLKWHAHYNVQSRLKRIGRLVVVYYLAPKNAKL